MVVAVAGGHGKIGLLLARQLSARGDRVLSLIRNPDHAGDIESAGAEPVLCDLEHAEPEELAQAIGDADAVVFAAGAGPGSGAARKETVDYGAAVLLIKAARIANATRYVMVSAISADADHPGEEVFDVYIRAKGRADEELAESGLDFTIIRPGGLTDDDPSGLIDAAPKLDRGEITRADVAATVVAALDMPTTAGLTFDLVGGDRPIDQALSDLTS